MYKLITNAEDTDDLSSGFDLDRKRRQREVTNNRNQRRKNHVRILLRDIFGFAEHQGNATFGLGCELPITSSDNSALKKDNATILGKVKFKNY